MPYSTIAESVKSLDNVRLQKQILECYHIHQVALGLSDGYKNHPVVKHYARFPEFIKVYGLECCYEYLLRTGKLNKFYDYFMWDDIDDYIKQYEQSNYIPIIYAEFSKNEPRCIRELDKEKVCKLFKDKLVKKWNADKEKGRNPKWSYRGAPTFYNNN